MGVVATEVIFEGGAPELSSIADKVAELSGLALSIRELSADVKANLYDLQGYLAFACAPGTQLEVYAYRAGAVRELYHQTFGDADLPIARCVQGLHEAEGTQAVYLRGYLGQELTLLVMTTLALEALGGRPREPIGDEERRHYGTPITPAQLHKRHRKLARQTWPILLVGLLLLPVLTPLWLAGIFVRMPWRIWKAYRLYRDYTRGREGTGRAGRCT